MFYGHVEYACLLIMNALNVMESEVLLLSLSRPPCIAASSGPYYQLLGKRKQYFMREPKEQ